MLHSANRADIAVGYFFVSVISVDSEPRSVKVRMNGKEYSSLSAAARVAAGGTSQNGWIYWGLKKQVSRPRSR